MGNYLEMLGQQLGTGAATNLLGTGMGLLLEGHNDRRQVRQQQRLQELQMQGSKEMTDYNMSKQLEMWKATSYGAQVEQMKKAGINPALLYGMSGGGGTTAGNASGQVTGADAPKGGHEVIDAMGISMQAAQLSLLKAEKEKLEAEAKNINADATNKPLVGKNIQMSTDSLAQGIKNQQAIEAYTRAQTVMQDIQNDIQGMEANDIKATIRYGMRKLYAEMQSAEIQQNVDKQTQDLKVRQAKADIALTVADAWLKSQEGTLPEYQIRDIRQRINFSIQENMRQWDKLGQNQTQLNQQQDRIDYDTAVPPELKEILDMIFLIPGGGPKKVNPVGFKIK